MQNCAAKRTSSFSFIPLQSRSPKGDIASSAKRIVPAWVINGMQRSRKMAREVPSDTGPCSVRTPLLSIWVQNLIKSFKKFQADTLSILRLAAVSLLKTILVDQHSKPQAANHDEREMTLTSKINLNSLLFIFHKKICSYSPFHHTFKY